VVLVFLALLGGTFYLYAQKIGPFSLKSYSEETFFSGISIKISEIKSSSYAMSAGLSVVPRDEDAKPFKVEVSNDAELKKKYFYDSQRASDVGSILSMLKWNSGVDIYNPKATTIKTFPQNIKNLYSAGTYASSKSINDPETNKEYEYKTTDGGNNFQLTVNFATDEAIKSIKRYGYAATTTLISGRKVTFTKDSSHYIYMSTEPPKPFLVTLSESLRGLPADVNFKFTFGATTELKPEGLPDWSFDFDAVGDFGDLSYKVNAEALKKNKDYYFKINNIPSLFGDLSNVKGKWVKIPHEEATTTSKNSYSMLSYIKSSISETEADYKENRANSSKLLKRIIEIADEEKLISFRSEPKTEKVGDRQLVKYDLTINKESILPFYKKLQQEITQDKDFKEFEDLVDQGLIDYLQSDEFDDVFDYFDKNNKVLLWTDNQGFPAIIENIMRVVPPDTATQLEGKQIKLVFKISLNNINEKIEIVEPKDFTLIDKLISDFEKNTGEAGTKAKDAAVKANINSIRASAELFYDDNAGYGKSFALGSCKKTAGTLFADSYVVTALENATDKNISSATCVVKGTGLKAAYAVSVPLPSDKTYNWCIDSVGNSKQIIGAVKSEVCK
jgi:hypothetical protein